MQKEPVRQSWCFTVGQGDVGLRLDQLISLRTGIGRRKVREILGLGGVQVNRRRVRVAGRKPCAGAEIRVTVDESLGKVPDIKPDILFEDKWVLAVNKPFGIPTQGTQASDRHDFLAVMRRYFLNEKLYLTHRLDTGTSGVLLLAKGSVVAGEISSLFRNRAIKKTYLAMIPGHLEPCLLEKPIGRILGSQPVLHGCEGSNLIGQKLATTRFSPADVPEICNKDGFWVFAEPLTGRTHQIRVHLAHLGLPIIGDVLYGGIPSSRMWLHAWKMELLHPISKEIIKIQADIC